MSARSFQELIRRKVFACHKYAGLSTFTGDRTFNFAFATEVNGGFEVGVTDGKRRHKLMARLNFPNPPSEHRQELLAHVVPQPIDEQNTSARRHGI